MSVNPRSEFLREPNLLVPGTKPLGPVALDLRNSLVRGLVGCWILQPGMRFVQDLTGYNHGNIVGDVVAGPIGINQGAYVSSSGTADRIALGSIPGGSPLNIPSNHISILSRFVHGPQSNDYPRIIDKSSGGFGEDGWAFYIDSGNRLSLDFGSSGKRFSSVIFNFVSGSSYTCGITLDTVTKSKRFIHVDGETITPATSTTGTIPQATTNATLLNWSHSTSREYQQPVEFIYVWDRFLSLIEHQQLVHDPYQFVVPA